MGLVDFVVAPEKLREEVQAYASALARKPADALAAIRRYVTRGSISTTTTLSPSSSRPPSNSLRTPDFAKGFAPSSKNDRRIGT